MNEFFDNSTVAGLIIVTLGFFIGSRMYKEQKNIDRRYNAAEKLGEALLLSEEHCKAVNLHIDKLVNTYNRFIKEGNEDDKKRFKDISIPIETEKIGKILMDLLPEDTSRMQSIVSLYFHKEKEIEERLEKVLAELKNWHDFVQNYLLAESEIVFDRTKKTSEIPELSLIKINSAIKELISNLH